MRPVGFARDCEKYARAAGEGWTVIRATPDQVSSGEAANWLIVWMVGEAVRPHLPQRYDSWRIGSRRPKAGCLPERATYPANGMRRRMWHMKELLLWPAQNTQAPKLAVDGDRWAVVTWGRDGVQLATGHIEDIKEVVVIEPTPTPEPGPEPTTVVTNIDTTVEGTALRAYATVKGPWDWIIWTVGNSNGRVHTIKGDDLHTTIEDIPPGKWHVTASATRIVATANANFEVAAPIVEPGPPTVKLPWIDISVTIPTPGSGPYAAMLDRGRLRAIQDLGVVGVRYNLHFMRPWESVIEQVKTYSEYFPIDHHIPIIDWSEAGTSPDPDADPAAVAAFAVKVVREFGFPFVELGNEVWQHDSPTSEYFRVAVHAAQALYAQTDCTIGICCDFADYGTGRRRSNVETTALVDLLEDTRLDGTLRFIPCVHPYPNPRVNIVTLERIADVLDCASPADLRATEWGVKSDDPAGLVGGLDELRRAQVPLVSLYAYNDGPPDYMGLLKDGNVRTATGEALAQYIAQMRKDHGRETPPDPVVPPDPITVKPTIPAAKDMSGDYLNGIDDFADVPGHALFLLPAQHPNMRKRMLEAYAAKYPGGFVPFAPWGEYHGVNAYDYRSDPAGLIEVIEDVHDFGCKPVLFCFADNFGAKRWSLQQCLDFVEDYLPKVTPALGDDPFLVLSWEGEQSLDALGRTRQDDVNPWDRWEQLVRRVRRLEPRGELGLHLPPNEWSPLIRHTGEGTYQGMRQIPVDPNAVLRRMQRAGATALLMQWAPEMSDEHIVEEGHISAAGPGAKPDGGIVARVVRAGLKYYLFEARRTAESARRLSDRVKALSNQGVSGGCNGWVR